MILRSFLFPVGHLEVNLFILGDRKTGQAVMIDAGAFDESVTRFVEEEGFTVSTILLTHLHTDHVAGLADYVKAWGCPVVSPAPLDAAPDARIVAEGDAVDAAAFHFDVLQTSGHTPESISYYCAEAGLCFVGDAIFSGAVGGTSSDEFHAEEIGHIQRNLMTLPPKTELYSGHGPATTVEIEKAANPFLQPGFTRLP